MITLEKVIEERKKILEEKIAKAKKEHTKKAFRVLLKELSSIKTQRDIDDKISKLSDLVERSKKEDTKRLFNTLLHELISINLENQDPARKHESPIIKEEEKPHSKVFPGEEKRPKKISFLKKAPSPGHHVRIKRKTKHSSTRDWLSHLLTLKEEKRQEERHKPQKVAVETLLWSKNKKTALQVAEARGVILLEAARSGVRIYEYNPNEIKLAVTGYGKSDKKQVIDMVEKLVKLKKKKRHDDEYDAIATAITCSAISLSTDRLV